MSPALQVVFYLLAVICFLAAAWGVHTVRRPVTPTNLLAFGLALVTFVALVAAWRAM